MAEDRISNELIYETLKALRDDVRDLRGRIERVESELLAVKGQLSALTQSVGALVHADFNRDSELTALRQRVERIERRLELNDGKA